jgi:aminoglycoside phosphotransferase
MHPQEYIPTSQVPEAVSLAICSAFPGVPGIVPQPLARGLSGARVFRFAVDGQDFVVRQSQYVERSEREIQCWRGAAALGIAPRLIHADAASGTTISEFIPGEPLDRSAAGIERIALALRTLHGSRAFGGGIPMAAILAGEMNRIGVNEPDTVIEAICEAAAEADTISRDNGRVPCHFDLNPTNILQTGDRVLFIDWETAGLGDPYIDLAQLGVFVFPAPDQQRMLLQAYLQRTPASADLSRLAVARVIALAFYAMGFFMAARGQQADLALEKVTPLDWRELFPLLMAGGAQSAPGVIAATLAAEMVRTRTAERYRQALDLSARRRAQMASV